MFKKIFDKLEASDYITLIIVAMSILCAITYILKI